MKDNEDHDDCYKLLLSTETMKTTTTTMSMMEKEDSSLFYNEDYRRNDQSWNNSLKSKRHFLFNIHLGLLIKVKRQISRLTRRTKNMSLLSYAIWECILCCMCRPLLSSIVAFFDSTLSRESNTDGLRLTVLFHNYHLIDFLLILSNENRFEKKTKKFFFKLEMIFVLFATGRWQFDLSAHLFLSRLSRW